jgi:spermidine synthase
MRRTSAWAVALYGLTGFTGVLAEQGFEKYIALLVGATAFSSAIVIFAYFLGFAIGAWAIAALVRRGRISSPLLTYGSLELLVGFFCVGFTYGFHPIAAQLARFQSSDQSVLETLAVRFMFGAVLILPAAVLMGASFPLIAQALDPEDGEHGGKQDGRCWILAYGANLGGAVAAALVGAYVILPAVGVRGAMWVCLAGAAIVFIASIALPEGKRQAFGRISRAAGTAHKAETVGAAVRERVEGGGLLLAAAFFSGVVFFSLEVLWTHLLGTLLGSSVYAFASMLACVLAGLFIGALRARRVGVESHPAAFAKLFQAAGVLLIVQYRLWDYIQIAFLVQIPAWLKSFYTIEGYKFLLGALMIVPVASLLGTMYPLLLRSPALARPRSAFFVGYLNMANSGGCLLGAILGVFFFIPVLGSEWSLKAIAALLLALGLLLFWREKTSRSEFLTAAMTVLLALGFAAWARWQPVLLTSGQNVYFGRSEKAAGAPAKPEENRSTHPPASPPAAPEENRFAGLNLLYFAEHAQGGFTSVVEVKYTKAQPRRMLLSNGKFEGTDDLGAQGFAQIAFAAIPSQFTSGFGRALQIGFGTGQSVHTLARMGFDRVDIAEYAPGVIGAAPYFAKVNGGVLGERNVHLSLEDGRNFLLVAPDRAFDVISIEITSVWFAGATNLYSREFYELVKEKLRPGGAFQQWVQFHHTSPRELGAQIATLRSVFPYVSVWSAGGQGMLVATGRPQMLTPERRAYMEERLRSLAGVPPDAQSELLKQCFDSRLLAPDAVDRLVRSEPFVINTDHNRWIEYATPRYNWLDDDGSARNFAWLRSFAGPESASVTGSWNAHGSQCRDRAASGWRWMWPPAIHRSLAYRSLAYRSPSRAGPIRPLGYLRARASDARASRSWFVPSGCGFWLRGPTNSRNASAAWLSARRAGCTSRIGRATLISFTFTSRTMPCRISSATHMCGRNATPSLRCTILRIDSMVGISRSILSGTLCFWNSRMTTARYGETTLCAMNCSSPSSVIDTSVREANACSGDTMNARWSVYMTLLTRRSSSGS